MKKCLGSLLLVAVFGLAMPSILNAQGGSDLELNIYGAATVYSKSNFEISFPQSVSPIKEQFKFPTGIRGGLRFNVFNRGHWGQEFVYSYEPSDATFVRNTAPTSTAKVPIRIQQIAVNGLYFFSENEDSRLRAFASFGLGALIFAPTAEGTRLVSDPRRLNIPGFGSSSELMFNYGIGVKNRLSNRLGARFDVKGYVNRNPSFDLPRASRNAGDIVLPNTGAMHHAEVSGGIVIYFGK